LKQLTDDLRAVGLTPAKFKWDTDGHLLELETAPAFAEAADPEPKNQPVARVAAKRSALSSLA